MRGNINIADYGLATRFGKARGANPSIAARKKNMEQHAQSIALALKRLMQHEIDIGQPVTIQQLITAFSRDGRPISGAQLIAIKQFLRAWQGDTKLLQQITDVVDGKQVAIHTKASIELADIITNMGRA